MDKTRTKREIEASKLEAEAKAMRRAEKAFWSEVEERMDEIREHFDMSDKFDEICRTYGAYTDTEKETLYRHLISDRQVDYYRRIKPDGSAASSF